MGQNNSGEDPEHMLTPQTPFESQSSHGILLKDRLYSSHHTDFKVSNNCKEMTVTCSSHQSNTSVIG